MEAVQRNARFQAALLECRGAFAISGSKLISNR
jgi:hypothetical protein